MATYCTEADLIEAYGAEQVLIASDRDGSGVSDPGVIAAAIAAASDEMDSYIGVKYELPLSATPQVMQDWCCVVTMFRMSPEASALTEEKRNRYNDAVKWLSGVAKGHITLGVSEGNETADDVPTLSAGTTTRQFTREKMGNL
jgi:phage gp36-like protein